MTALYTHTASLSPLSLHPALLRDADAASSRAVADAPLVDSDALLRGHKTVEIRHNGAVYRLQATRLGKLILTK
ncbi:hemin uptake protein HemP [uncultured Xylophilus sp.]|uniref:hemin uptake protein HemP n=1 Tax=uncultured Xylophilus sp. TaxID=296832 RepID=UPI0025F2A140|nr:hemin uptake protein HemP [uncultured Xylophilus sp.]